MLISRENKIGDEGGKEIGELSNTTRQDRLLWYMPHNVQNDKICKNNCLDVCRSFNNSYKIYHK